MKINDLSISDLKASYDFVLIYLKQFEDESDKVGVKADTIQAYNEVKSLEDKLYSALLNKVLILK